jgi:hypothetical protein
MSPFRSKAQMRAAFSGALGSKMKRDAKEWADKTPNPEDLPEHADKEDTEKSFPVWSGKVISLDMAYEEKLIKAYSGGKTGKTEHAGAKHGQGYWGRKGEAKEVSNALRREADKKGLEHWQKDYEEEKKLQWQKKTKTGKIITAHRRKSILNQVKEATKQGLLKPGLSKTPSQWKEYLRKREIMAGN